VKDRSLDIKALFGSKVVIENREGSIIEELVKDFDVASSTPVECQKFIDRALCDSSLNNLFILHQITARLHFSQK
jgi:hypothetical protein